MTQLDLLLLQIAPSFLPIHGKKPANPDTSSPIPASAVKDAALPASNQPAGIAAVLALFALFNLFTPVQLHAQVIGPKGRDPGKTDRELFIDAARVYLGTPYTLGGSTSRGIDCSGLVYRAALDGPDIQLPRTVETLSSFVEHIPDQSRDRGDLLFFNTTGKLSHVGIYLGDGQFIHSASDGPKTGVIISKLNESYWNKAYRFTGRLFKPSSPTGLSDGTGGGSAIGSSSGDGTDNRPGSGAGGVTDSPLMLDIFPFSGEIGLRANLSGAFLWDFMPNEFPLRGGTVGGEITWAKGTQLMPGLGAGLTWDTRTESLSFPVYASLAGVQGLRFFMGTQFHLLAEAGLSKTPQFPGIIGLSWTSPPARALGQNIRFYQSMEYSWFPDETSNTGFRLSTGITLSYDL